MRVVVCVRQGLDGELGAFDAAAYEAALRLPAAEVILLSMGPPSVAEFLQKLTRLGAKRAILLSDGAFAGADTLATAYTLSLAVKRLTPDLVLCGRQTLVGDTAQTGPMLAALCGYALLTNVMALTVDDKEVSCLTRDEGECRASLPALLTVERIHALRLPRLRARMGELEIWDAAALGADVSRCGLAGSPTRVIKTFENEGGKRQCHFIRPDELQSAIAAGLRKNKEKTAPPKSAERLQNVCIVGEAPRAFAEAISDDITLLQSTEVTAEMIRKRDPSAVFFGSDPASKRLAAELAATLRAGLCADCTAAEVSGGELFLYRPALSGSIMAKIGCITRPAMATVRTAEQEAGDVILTAGYGVKEDMERVRALAARLNATLCTTRKMVDRDLLPYEMQVGLTGKTVAPPVYIAAGVSGAVHHIAGMQRAGTVIAINRDKDAPIFDYADYGIVANIEEL